MATANADSIKLSAGRKSSGQRSKSGEKPILLLYPGITENQTLIYTIVVWPRRSISGQNNR